MLDIGCGVGLWAKEISDRKESIIYGIDILEKNIEIARNFNSGENINYAFVDFLRNEFEDNYFDCVIFLETIEHVESPIDYLREIFRVLKPEGILIISTPNSLALYRFIKNIIYLLKHKREKFFKEIEIEKRNTGTQNDHIFLWDYECFFRLLNRNGFAYVDHTFAKNRFFKSKIFNRILSPFCMVQIFKVKKIVR